MMHSRIVSVSTVLGGALCLAMALPAIAQERAHQRTRSHTAWFEREKVKTALGLTAAQVQDLHAEQAKYLQQRREGRKALRKAYRAFFQLLSQEGAPSEDVARARTNVETAFQEQVRATLDHVQRLRDILTPEQWQQLPQVAPMALRMGALMSLRGGGTLTVGAAKPTSRPRP